MNGPGDPEPSLVIEDGVVIELDGKPRERFDTLDRFIAAHGIDLEVAPEAMALADVGARAPARRRRRAAGGARAARAAASRRPSWPASSACSTRSR